MTPDARLEFATHVVTRLVEAGFEALWAGGCVRDLLLAKTPKDYDVATSARPEQVREVFGRRRTLAVGESFGVIVVLGSKDAGQIEVATFRSEGSYLDGRRPSSVTFCTAVEDAKRRDFTINGMFYDPRHERVLDFVGGERDLAAGIVRAIGDPAERMREDKLRMLRAVRFAATFEFHLDEDTATAVRSMASQIDVVSVERIAAELRRMLGHEHRDRALQLAADVHLLPEILPELQPVAERSDEWSRLLQHLRLLGEAGFPVAFAALFTAVADVQNLDLEATAIAVESAGRRLRLSNREIADAAWLVTHSRALRDAAGLSLARLKRTLAEPLALDLVKLDRADRQSLGQEPVDADFCDDFLQKHSLQEIDPPPLLTGRMLIERGHRPGPEFKYVLDTVRDAQLNLDLGTADEAVTLAEQLLADQGAKE
ncbi:CCA tRNA nucleotidyltransferase [bacterium]|nr:CCA tRNA nucleotidyltransferase [bacterium]